MPSRFNPRARHGWDAAVSAGLSIRACLVQRRVCPRVWARTLRLRKVESKILKNKLMYISITLQNNTNTTSDRKFLGSYIAVGFVHYLISYLITK